MGKEENGKSGNGVPATGESPKQKKESPQPSSPSSSESKNRFGTFKGVFIPSVLTIFGVIMYLRLGWVVGSVGLFGAIFIILLSSLITFLTAISISATATNMKVGGGGAYFMVSRSFGIEAGAAIGVPLYLAQALGITFYVAGFSESILAIFPSLNSELVEVIVLIALTALSYFSADLALRAQVFIFGVILFSIFSFALGSPVGEGAAVERGFFLGQAQDPGFWFVFAVFFPAVTGILSGVSLSGELKDPSRSLPRGTLAAVVTGFIVYVVLAVLLDKMAPEAVLKSQPLIMKDIALIPAAIFAGIWGASISSALGSLLGAPRTLQALAQDHVVPKALGKTFGAQGEPRIAIVITFFLAGMGIYIGGLDRIAAVLTMFFLTSYGALNLIAGLEGLIGNPSWRPTFRAPWWVSFGGAFACFAAMLMIDAGSTMVALFLCAGIYVFMRKRRMNARWSDIRRGLLTFLSRSSIYQLANFEKDARTWRPNMLVLSGSPRERWHLIETSDAITHGKGFLIVATIISQEKVSQERIEAYQKSMKEYLKRRSIPALVKVKFSEDFVSAAEGLISDYGLGPLVPNTIVFGDTHKEESLVDSAALIKSSFEARKNVLVFREGWLQKFEGKLEEKGLDDPIRKKIQKGTKVIDVWWGRQHNNAGLMLAIAYMLQTSQEWVGAKVRMKSLVKSEDERQGVIENLNSFLKGSRIEASCEVFLREEGRSSMETIGDCSSDADLVLLGMKPPEADETADDYSLYYEGLLEQTDSFPLTVLTLAGEDIEFKQIFN